MTIKRIEIGALGVNTYFLTENGCDCIVVDPGDDEQSIQQFLSENGLKAQAVLLTHAHFDHSNGVKFLQEKGATVYMHRGDVRMLNSHENLAVYCGRQFNAFSVDVFVEDGKSYQICGIDFTVMHTPGHSEGSVCYILSDAIISGDTLFYLSVGRTDFPGGSVAKLRASLQKLFALKKDYEVYPGHGQSTSLYFEKENNPYA